MLHVLSRAQSSSLLARLSRCARAGTILVGAAVGRLGDATEWALTPDGSAPRWLHSPETLRTELVASGWTEAVDVVGRSFGGEGWSFKRADGEGRGAGTSNDPRQCILIFSARLPS